MQIYDFEIEGQHVAGVACGDCADATTLGFIEGTLEPDRIRFEVRHVRDDGSTAWLDHLTARIAADQLLISGELGGAHARAMALHLHKDPRGPAPFAGVAVAAVLPQPGAPPSNAAAYGSNGQLPPGGFKAPRGAFGQAVRYQAPGPWEPITPDRLVGVWFAGTGHDKQHFIIRRVGQQLLGMVCGPCDNPYTMAALDRFDIHADTVTFRTHHEDFGLGVLPFYNVLTAHVAGNEMRIVSAIANNLPMQDQPFAYFAFSMIGPVSFEATSPPPARRAR
ncbi:MAG TPA: hypothetical protein VMF64_00085 [Steroidobacteraceae bacterium]|nr:hypothetical protein [Steroidobacteraceae bacterium]